MSRVSEGGSHGGFSSIIDQDTLGRKGDELHPCVMVISSDLCITTWHLCSAREDWHFRGSHQCYAKGAVIRYPPIMGESCAGVILCQPEWSETYITPTSRSYCGGLYWSVVRNDRSRGNGFINQCEAGFPGNAKHLPCLKCCEQGGGNCFGKIFECWIIQNPAGSPFQGIFLWSKPRPCRYTDSCLYFFSNWKRSSEFWSGNAISWRCKHKVHMGNANPTSSIVSECMILFMASQPGIS